MLGGVFVGRVGGSGDVVRGIVRVRFGRAWTGESEFDEQERDEAEDSEEDRDDHHAADAVPKAQLTLARKGAESWEEVQVKIQRDRDRYEADDDPSRPSDRTNDDPWYDVIEEHRFQGYQIPSAWVISGGYIALPFAAG